MDMGQRVRRPTMISGTALGRGERSQELATALLRRFGITPGDAVRIYANGEVETLEDERRATRLNHRVFKGRDGIHPGPRFLASIHDIDDDLNDAVALHWSAPLATAYRATVIERDHAGRTNASHFMVPSVVKALAEANAWPGGTLTADGKPVEAEDTQTWQLRSRRRLETPDWFVHLSVTLPHAQVSYATHNTITLAHGMPDTILNAMVGRRLHEIIAGPGIAPGTAAGDVVVRGQNRDTLQIDQAWEQAGPSSAGADTRWADLARIAAFATDDGVNGIS